MSSLFSVFDPSASTFPLLGVGKWVILFFPLVFMVWGVFCLPVGNAGLCNIMIKFIMSSLMSLMKLYSKFALVFGVVVFFSIFCWTGFGLIPYTYTLTSQLANNFSLSLAVCFSGVLSYLTFNSKSFFAHLLPLGAPIALGPFLVLVESVSLMIRPITLALRLTANVVAGHLLVVLLSEFCSSIWDSATSLSSIPLLFEAGLLVFEMAVVLIQSYVFFVLFSMYWAEAE